MLPYPHVVSCAQAPGSKLELQSAVSAASFCCERQIETTQMFTIVKRTMSHSNVFVKVVTITRVSWGVILVNNVLSIDAYIHSLANLKNFIMPFCVSSEWHRNTPLPGRDRCSELGCIVDWGADGSSSNLRTPNLQTRKLRVVLGCYLLLPKTRKLHIRFWSC